MGYCIGSYEILNFKVMWNRTLLKTPTASTILTIFLQKKDKVAKNDYPFEEEEPITWKCHVPFDILKINRGNSSVSELPL